MDIFRFGLLAVLACLASVAGAVADELTLVRNGETITLVGEILAEAEDGGILFLGTDGQLQILDRDEVLEKVDGDEVVPPLSHVEISEQLLAELPDGFRIHRTQHFVIAYNTERAYARWIGGLYERLFRGFVGYWDRKRGWELNREPKFPLVTIIFRSREEYERFVQAELGQSAGSMVAYYNILTNRVAMYDLTSDLVGAGRQANNDRRISEILATPNSLNMVATVIHEATHQLMFNTGMQTRMSDTPLWINEGMAMYFETPDTRSRSGWRSIGRVNRPRLVQFRQGIAGRPAGALASMLSSDERFHQVETAPYAYAEAWCFNYFLMKRHSDNYVAYLKELSTQRVLEYDSPEERLAKFQKFMGDDVAALEAEFLEFVQGLK